ncbi:MAG: hypothetical protein GY726_11965 [Proteobacteria bacterium]|nr:hypothetical protein [Pseudomonadota bacterium]
MKSDERILGDGDFTQSVLDEAKERLEERYRLQAQGYDLEKVTIRVSSELGIDPEQVWAAGKHRITVKARSLMCYWAVRRLGISTTELSKKLGVSQPSVSISVKRGEKIAKAMQFELIKGQKVIILWTSPNTWHSRNEFSAFSRVFTSDCRIKSSMAD